MAEPDHSCGADGAVARPEVVAEPGKHAQGVAAAADLLVEARHLVAGAQEALDHTWRLLAEGTPATTPSLPVPSPANSNAPATHRPGTRLGRWATLGVAVAGIALLSAGTYGIAQDRNQHAAALAVGTDPLAEANQASPPSSAPVAAPPSGRALPPAISDGVPTNLRISRLDVLASVSGRVSVETSGPEAGLLTAPDDYQQLGWYRHGRTGALVLDGHVGYRNNPGPLAFIGELRQGDGLVVAFPGGKQSYAVRVVASVVKGQLPQLYFTAPYDGYLMLITCDYQSAFRAGHFVDNLYVVAAPVD